MLGKNPLIGCNAVEEYERKLLMVCSGNPNAAYNATRALGYRKSATTICKNVCRLHQIGDIGWLVGFGTAIQVREKEEHIVATTLQRRRCNPFYLRVDLFCVMAITHDSFASVKFNRNFHQPMERKKIARRIPTETVRHTTTENVPIIRWNIVRLALVKYSAVHS